MRPATGSFASPIGPLTATVVDGRLTALHMAPHPRDARRDPALAGVVAQLDAYFAGERTAFGLPLAPAGTAFQRRVWEALREIPYGETISYRELAARAGNPAACRAAGHANGRNPIAIVVPCHRVVGADGRLTGYGGGLERKAWLLAHERRVLEPGA
ncbi:MAG TPA: methylated-DNA--[protein]-cysteine S-methyltransferase [Solirubrobacteraceae bacterium]|nr:methylated-DNA--[protein]-cysteine S-methyltransferase [Solirubrobacteraceae bacterium]